MSWIKMRSNLQTNPKVAMLAARLKVTVWSAVGALHAVWSLADQHTEDGTLRMNAACLDRLTGIRGIAAAMVSVGWLVENGDTLLIPGFDEHQSHSAKARAVDQGRKARGRNADTRPSSVRVLSESCPSSVREVSENGHGDSGVFLVPDKRREEKRREEKNKTEEPRAHTREPDAESPPSEPPTLTRRNTRTNGTTPLYAECESLYPPASRNASAKHVWNRKDLDTQAPAIKAGIGWWKTQQQWKDGKVERFGKFLEEELWKNAPSVAAPSPPRKTPRENFDAMTPEAQAETLERVSALLAASDESIVRNRANVHKTHPNSVWTDMLWKRALEKLCATPAPRSSTSETTSAKSPQTA